MIQTGISEAGPSRAILHTAGGTRQTRRLQLTGGSTYMVSLPKAWVEELALRRDSDVTLTKNPNGSVTIFQGEAGGGGRAVTSVGKDDSSGSVLRKIIAMYLSGYGTIEIRTRGMEIPGSHRGAIRELVRSALMGTEIIEASSERIVLQVMTQLGQLSFDVALRRMYITATNMHSDAMAALRNFDVKYAEEVIRMDDEVDRFSLYLMRNLNLALEDAQAMLDSGLERPSDCLGYRTIVRCVERIADHAGLIAKKIKHLSSPVDKRTMREIGSVSEDALGVFARSFAALSERDYAMAEGAASDATAVIERGKKIMDSVAVRGGNAAIIKLILEDVRRTAEYSMDICEIVIDWTVQSVITER